MKKTNSSLVSFNLIVTAAICNWGIIFYSIPQLDWFLILWPVVPTVLLMVAAYYMPREDSFDTKQETQSLDTKTNIEEE